MTQLVRLDTQSLANLNRALIGFDTLFENFENRFANQINSNYPPYNILKQGEDRYEIQIAVTGFSPDEISVQIDQDQLIIKGQSTNNDDATTYLHRGLAQRDFTRVFALAEHIEVGEASIKNGVLKIAITRIVPESLKPRVLKIKSE
jgi:molecular chaperone IbpA